MFDIKKVKEDAEKEVREEREKAAKERIKAKLKDLDKARAIMKNIERELEDLYQDIGNTIA